MAELAVVVPPASPPRLSHDELAAAQKETSNDSRRSNTSTSRCSATSPSPCPTSSQPDNDASYADLVTRLSVRSCSITTGRPIASEVVPHLLRLHA